MSNLKLLFYKIMSLSPVFRITDDERYNKIERKSNEFRCSVISFTVGVYSYFFFTWDSKKNFCWFYKLNLYDVQKYEINGQIFEDEYDKYLIELNNKSEKNINAEKEFLLLRKSEVEIQKNKTFNKFLAYIAIIVFILPLYAPELKNLTSYLNSYKIIYIFIMLNIIINITFLIYEILKVKNSKRVTFNQLRNAFKWQANNKLVAGLYYEWKNLNNELTMKVALIKNIEKYMSILFFVSISIVLSSNIEKYLIETEDEILFVRNDASVFIFSSEEEISFQELIKKQSQKINRMNSDILSGEYNQAIVMTSTDEELKKDFIQLISVYKSKKMSIIEIENKNYPQQIEIILVKE